MTNFMKFFLAAALASASLACSNGGENCTSHADTYCDERISYWLDSCGEIEEKKEDCAFGCKPDHSDCEPPECFSNQDCEQKYGPNWYCQVAINRCVEETCQPSCVGKCCGPDGCSGQCPNNCPAGMACESDTCRCVNICTPDCVGRECGPDGCGETCGTCNTGEFCDNGICSAVCGSSTCPHGCCTGTICQAGNSNSACGSGGITCDVCSGSDTCVSGVCTTPVDPCNGVTPEGYCLTATVIEYCNISGGTSTLMTYECPYGYICDVVNGWAICVVENECVDGETECDDATSINICVNGSWEWQACPADCVESALGDYCASQQQFETVQRTVTYEARGPNASMTDWGSIFDADAQGFIVQSVDMSQSPPEVYDSQVTDTDGNVWIDVPTNPGTNDYFFIFAAGERSDGELAFVVADPDLYQGVSEPGDLGAEPAIWAWGGRIQDLQAIGISIPESSGSGAARLFDYLRFIYANSENRWPFTQPGPIVIWLGMGVEWTCGACFGPWPEHQFGIAFDSQIWIGGGSDESYWSDATTAHELGHWVMQTFGTSPNEGGPHCLGVPTLPGQAWSEGWATWFSGDAREDSVYFSKQGGSFFWFSIDTRQYSGGYPWNRPEPWWGLLQDMDENEVSAMLWNLSYQQGLTSSPLDDALASNRMNYPPFGRGYNRHTWDMDGCDRFNVTELNESAPMVADFFDALVCDGVSAWMIDEATEPDLHYPYPSDDPICWGPRAPIRAQWEILEGQPAAGGDVSLVMRVIRQGDWPMPVYLRVDAPDGVEVIREPKTHVLPANFGPEAGELEMAIRITRVPDQDLVMVLDSRIDGAGLHAEIPYRFGRPEPRISVPIRTGPRLKYGRYDMGRAIELP